MGLNKRLIGAGATDSAGGITPSENFQVVTYTGTSAEQSITGVGFQPDLVWIKDRGNAEQHILNDSTRGATKDLSSNSTAAEATRATGFTSFDSDGFTLGTDGGGVVNDSSRGPYVAWCWKANGGTTSSNSDGSITTTVQNNAAAGFSIITYTGNGTVGATIGHGLGYVPNMFAVKKRSSGTTNWRVYHTYTDATNPQNYNLEFNGTGAKDDRTEWNDTMPTSSVISLNAHDSVNQSGSDYVCYAWTDIDGFSKFGGYTGNGGTSNIIEIGFEPAFVMIKYADEADQWVMHDNKRDTQNPRTSNIRANSSDAEIEYADYAINFLSNGFELLTNQSAQNKNNGNYIYMAFAADPDEEAPTLASSFNIETWRGNGSGLSVTGLGFRPGLIWGKARTAANSHSIFDIVRGVNKELNSNSTDAQGSLDDGVLSFNSDGWTMGDRENLTQNNEDFVGWSWKVDDNEPTIEATNADTDAVGIFRFEDNLTDVTGTYSDAGNSGISYTTGKFNKSIVFDSGDYFRLNIDALFNSWQNMSYSFWFKTTTSSMGRFVTGYSANNYLASSYISANGKLGIESRISNSDTYVNGTTALNDGNWHHAVIIYNNTLGRIYLYADGELEATGIVGANASGSFTLTNNVVFGASQTLNSNLYVGEMDQLRFYDKALTAASVTNLYNETTAQNSTLDIGTQYQDSITSIVSANANAGFSIVRYTGTGADAKVPHGLSASLDMLIVKGLETTNDWSVLHKDGSNGDFLQLNGSSGESGAGSIFGSTFTRPTATVFTVGNTGETGTANKEYIAYCFHSVTGYQKFGSYTGNGSSTGPSVTTGFKPDFIMIKRIDATEDWKTIDSRRGFANTLEPNENIAEETGNNSDFTFSSTGFQIGDTNGDFNANGGSYIYWAIAKNVPSNTTLASSFGAVFYAGSSTNARTISTYGFKPDLVWNKALDDSGYSHFLTDSLRGGTKVIQSNSDAAETTRADNIQSFDSGGYTINNDGTSNYYRTSYIAWGWKAGNTWQSNVDGTIPSTVNVNTANGFSIIKYTGTSASSQSVGHGLSSTPELVMIKKTSGTEGWIVWYPGASTTNYLVLNTNAATATGADWGGTHSSTVVNLQNGPSARSGSDGEDYIAYCWHSVSNFSKIGTYTGTGSSNSITGLGFAPDFVMLKNVDSARGWQMFDSLRGINQVLFANSTSEESNETAGTSLSSFDSDGFTVGTGNGVNESGDTFIYMAFKKNATNNNTLANSFKVKTYTGNGSTQEITGIGFKADLLWIKQTNDSNPHGIWDTTRGAGKLLKPNSSDAEINNVGDLVGYFLDDGFQVNRNHGVHSAYDNTNHSGSTYVAWAWKAGNGWQSNTDGAISSLTNANTGNKFSVVRYKGTGSATTVGHDLGYAPTFMIVKTVESSAKWRVYHSTMGGTKAMNLNDAFGPGTSANYWNDTAPTSSVFSVGQDLSVNGENHIAYVWSDCDGYSKFSTYTGTGSTQTITTGFRPDWILTKDITQASDNWRMYDTVRGLDKVLYPALTQAQDTNATGITAVTSTGFTLGTGNLSNKNGSDYIYIAFKMN